MDPAPPELNRARNYLLSNLVGVPGVGTFLAGRRVTGAVQITVSSFAFVMTMYWFSTFIHQWVRMREFPFDGGPQFRYGLIGAGIYFVVWLWGLTSGLRIRRAAHTNKP